MLMYVKRVKKNHNDLSNKLKGEINPFLWLLITLNSNALPPPIPPNQHYDYNLCEKDLYRNFGSALEKIAPMLSPPFP